MTLPERIGRYEIIAELGRGAMGSVFKARDPAVGRTVALKTIHSAALAGDQSEEYRQRFYREARASGVLAHPGIVPVFDVGEHEGAPFLVMEYVDGRTLADAIKKSERFPLDRVCEIGQQIAEALGYAHRQGVIHRDIKPANILLTSREVYGAERPRITDFGIAKLTSLEITTAGQLLGTPSFMPPEQFTGSPIDGRADLFSLGVILYSLTTGEQPFAGETMTAVSYKVVYTEPIPPSKLNPATSARLEAAILKCLAKNPAERFQTGEEVAQELAAIRANPGPAAAHPVVPAVMEDTNATLGPATAAALAQSSARLGTIGTPSQAAAPQEPAVPPVAPAATKKQNKPIAFETLFAVILLSVAALAAAIAGSWFMFTHIRGEAAKLRDKTTVPVSLQPVPAVQSTVPAPQLVAPTAPATDQMQPQNPAGQTATTQPATTQPAPAANQSSAANSKPATPPPALVPPVKPAAATPAKPKPASKTASMSSPAVLPPSQPVAKVEAPPAPASTPATASATPGANVSAAKSAPADFDPRKLDPNTSTKLKIQLNKLPSGLPLAVNMNKKPYLSFVTGDKTDLENLYVPAGVQEFRVSINSGGQQFDSNIVSDDFKAKKKKTLKIELLENGSTPPKVAVPLNKDVQVFLSFPILSF